jgi:hypothetical protein
MKTKKKCPRRRHHLQMVLIFVSLVELKIGENPEKILISN